MNKTTKIIIAVLAVIALVACVFAFTGKQEPVQEVANNTEATVPAAVEVEEKEPVQDIVVLFTNDVHCGIEDSIGYAGLAAYRNHLLEKTPNVLLVDAGDWTDGDTIGTVSKGMYIVDIMNEVGYDYITLGNHEFGPYEDTKARIDGIEAKIVVSNLEYLGSGETYLDKTTKYEIADCNGVKVAFLGVVTPETITKAEPGLFMEGDEWVYTFHHGSEEEFFGHIEGVAQEARAAGADYVVAIAHIGDDPGSAPWTSTDLATKTAGIDAILDGHSHSTVPSRILTNTEGKDVYVCSTGTKLAAIGQLTISPNGFITTGLITDYAEKDAEIDAFIQNIKASYEEEVNKVVATSNTALSISDASGVRMVRNRENALANLSADGYRYAGNCDIGWVNGGGVRADLPEGDITYADIIKVHPFGNMLCVAEATGQEILDALEWSSRLTMDVYADNGNAVAENGGFLQVSGLKYTINTSIPSPCVADENGLFLEVNGERRVSDVVVENKETGEYEPIDPEKVYTLATHNYMLKSAGDGYTMFQDNTFLVDEAIPDYQVLINYITVGLNGDLSAYADVEGRITVK